jgi:hypothetical protein
MYREPESRVARSSIFKPKNPNLGKIWRVLQWKMSVYFMSICFIIQPFGNFYGNLVYFMAVWYIFSVLVLCSKKHLATLPESGEKEKKKKMLDNFHMAAHGRRHAL